MTDAVPSILHAFAATTRPAEGFVEIVRGQGSIVWDADGRDYVDGTASLWYCNVGHGRTEIADAVARQMAQLASYHTFQPFTNRPAEEFVERLLPHSPLPDGRVFLAAGGSEAVDSAIKLSRVAHYIAGQGQRVVILSRKPSYHGVTYGGLSLTGLPLNRAGFGPLLPETYQTTHDSLAEMREAVAYHSPDRIAAIVAEPVIGAGGLYPPAPGYLEGLRELCDECGAFLVFDEVITGFGRLGTWFGAQHFGVTPDLITFAKGATSGYLPLGGVIVGARACAQLESDERFYLRHGNTYAGHPTCCAAGIANLEIIEREQLPDRAAETGRKLRAGLETLRGHPLVADVRGVGMMQALALAEGADAMDMQAALLTHGVIGRALPAARAVAFSPPLVLEDAELDRIVSACGEALTGMLARS